MFRRWKLLFFQWWQAMKNKKKAFLSSEKNVFWLIIITQSDEERKKNCFSDLFRLLNTYIHIKTITHLYVEKFQTLLNKTMKNFILFSLGFHHLFFISSFFSIPIWQQKKNMEKKNCSFYFFSRRRNIKFYNSSDEKNYSSVRE